MSTEAKIRNTINKIRECHHSIKVIAITQEVADELCPEGLTLETYLGIPVIVTDRNKIIYTVEKVESSDFLEG